MYKRYSVTMVLSNSWSSQPIVCIHHMAAALPTLNTQIQKMRKMPWSTWMAAKSMAKRSQSHRFWCNRIVRADRCAECRQCVHRWAVGTGVRRSIDSDVVRQCDVVIRAHVVVAAAHRRRPHLQHVAKYKLTSRHISLEIPFYSFIKRSHSQMTDSIQPAESTSPSIFLFFIFTKTTMMETAFYLSFKPPTRRKWYYNLRH